MKHITSSQAISNTPCIFVQEQRTLPYACIIVWYIVVVVPRAIEETHRREDRMGEVLRAAWLGEVVSMMVVREEEEEQGARCGGALRDDGARGRAIERFARTPRHATPSARARARARLAAPILTETCR
jgi:hypothetical protein